MANLNAVLTRPRISENYSRNAFDRGFSTKVTYQLGGLTPFFAEPFIAGSNVKLNRSIFQRTKAVNTAAFPTVDTHCEFFYVPIRQLWSFWNNWKLNIQDYGSSLWGGYNSQGVFTPRDVQVPVFNLIQVQYNIANLIGNQGKSDYNQYFTTLREAVEANRLLDCLGYGFIKGTEVPEDQGAFYVNAFKLAAYQKVYYDHFRNTAYETNDPSFYNLDFWSTPSQPLNKFEIAKLCTYRYVNYRKDYFQSIYPALNYVSSSPSGVQWNLPDSVIYAVSSATQVGVQNVYGNNTSGGQTVVLNGSNSSGSSWSSVQQIRSAFALDKLLRASAYAPKHVRDQFEARYGVKGVESDKESVRIGAFMNDIIFQEVTNTAQDLGAIGAKGIGSNGYGKDIEFTCKEDCIILGLMYSLPRSAYDSNRIMNWNSKIQREDFFIPEYMNLGMQPLYQFEAQEQFLVQDNNMKLLGYQPRYMEYKQGIDTNHGLFNDTFSLSDFTNHTQKGKIFIDGTDGVSSSYFKVSPYDLDSVFVQSTDPANMATDSFITYLDIKCVSNQNMSVHGQPVNGSIA